MSIWHCFRFLLDIRWYKQWKKYVGFDSWDTLNAGDETFNPGPIDNSALFKGQHLILLLFHGVWLSIYIHFLYFNESFILSQLYVALVK